MTKKELWIFNHYAQGLDLPGGTRHYDLALELVNKGYSVTIFASGFHHVLLKDVVNYNEDGYYREVKENITFIWVKTYPYYINNCKRMCNIVSYAIKIYKITPKLKLNKPDIIIGSSVHPIAPMIALKMALKFNAKFIFEIRDLWPQTFIDMGLWKKDSLKSKCFKFIEKISVKYSNKIIVLSPLTISYLKEEYQYKTSNVLLLPNGVSEKMLVNKPSVSSSKKINITYLGGIDSVHGLGFLVDIAKHLDNKVVEINIYGEGKEKKNLKEKMVNNKVSNIIWHDSIPKLEVPKTLSKSDLLFVSTSNVLYGSENKLYDYMASGKPVVIAISGQHNNPIKKIGCGISLDRDNIELSAIRLLDFIIKEKLNFSIIGKKGRDYVIKNRTMNVLSNELINFLKS